MCMIRSVWPIRSRPKALPRPPRPRTPISSSSTPAISARRPPRRSTRSSDACGCSSRKPRRRAARSWSRSPAAWRRPRARKSSAAPTWSISSSARRTTTDCRISSPAPGVARRSSTPSFRSMTNSPSSSRRARRRRAPAAYRHSSPCRRVATSSARSASCPIRAALKSRGRSRASSPKSPGSPTRACAKSR